MKSEGAAPGRRWTWHGFEPRAAALALGWCAVRLARGIGPDPYYNSDCAAPILMMQGLGEGPFTLYYPRQDRFGMWPFLLGRWLHLGTPEAFQIFSVVALCSAVLPLWRVLGNPAVAVLGLLLPIVLNRTVALTFFQTGQPYLWQVVALCWAWAACREVFEASTARRRAWAVVALATFATLATWISPASLVALLCVIAIEALGARSRPGWIAAAVGALGISGLADSQLRRVYNAYCAREFGATFVSALKLDRGHLLSNLAAVVALGWRDGVLLPLGLAAGALALPGRAREERTNQLVLLALAVHLLPALVLVQHFRLNFFNDRYLAFPAFWAVAAAVHGGAELLGVLAPRRREMVTVLALVALAIAAPLSPPDPLAAPRSDAARLVGTSERILLGDYWAVYVPASLARRGALAPLPLEHQASRFPWLQAELRPGREVVAPCGLDGPDGTFAQYGATLRRTPDAPILASGGPWCLHAVDHPARPPGSPR